jgi:RNA polymerase sigma-70 factor, ECF subfamily
LNDEDIALSIQQGNSEALAYLVERHHSRLVGYLYLMLGGDRPQAEDFAQEAFLKVVQAIAKYTYPRPFKPWLYAIAVNLVRNYHARAERRQTSMDGIGFEKMPDEADGVEDDISHRGDINQMLMLLGSLPAAQREAILLRYVECLPLADIAELLDVPIGTVKSRVSIGLSMLRTLMQKDDKP